MAPYSQEWEPPANPARFKALYDQWLENALAASEKVWQTWPGGIDAENASAVRKAAMEAALAARPVLPVETPAEGLREDWHTMATAPKDGDWFIARQDDSEYPCAWVVADDGEGGIDQGWFDYFNQSFEEPTEWHPRASTAPAPLSDRDGSLREACPDCGRPKARNVGDAAAGNCPKWWAVTDKDADADCARAALAAVPPETAEMEGETARLTRELNYARGRREYWKQKAIEAAEDERDRLYAQLHEDGGSFSAWAEIWLSGQYGAMFPADRLAARASSSGEVGDE